MMNVTYITTTSHNVGDDFAREGITYLLRHRVRDLRIRCIHKHLPITARPGFKWIHDRGFDCAVNRLRSTLALKATNLVDRLLPLRAETDLVLTADILVQAGAPVYWLSRFGNCADNEWWVPLIERRWLKRSCGKFLSVAGGTCQPYRSDGSEFSAHQRVLDYVRRFYDLTSLTTLRDNLSAKVLGFAGRVAHVLPCTSIFARREFGIEPQPGEFIALNYMPGGGHYDFDQSIDARRWETEFVRFANGLSRRERCVLVCHSESEEQAARRLLPAVPVFRSSDAREILQFYARARGGVVNRVHAGFALASFGRPVFLVGTDTRAKMAELINLEFCFVGDANAELLAEKTDQALAGERAFSGEFRERSERARVAYLELLEGAGV